MNDELSTPDRRRVSTSATPPEPKKGLYVVKGSDIWTEEGRQAEGSTVELTPAEARHFTKVGRLAPYIPGEELEG